MNLLIYRMTKNSGQSRDLATDRKAYIDAWTEMMVNIWRDKMVKLKAVDTGALYSSLSGKTSAKGPDWDVITHKFVEYGFYVDAGVGKGYKADNSGDLLFLDPSYRAEHNLGEARKKKRWFSASYSISFRKLMDAMSEIYGEDLLNDLINTLENKKV